MSWVRFTKPSAFTTGIVSGIIEGAATPSNAQCNLPGSATFSWLLRFDLAAGTLTTGASKPSPSSAGPYTFVDEMLNLGGTPFHIQPVKLMAPLASDCTFESSAGDVLLPIYLDAGGSSMILLPLRAVRITDTKLTPDHSCIGRYNAEGLDPLNTCLSDAQHPTFVPGGHVEAFMTLEDADKVLISPLSQTLCVLLSQNASMYGTKDSMNVTVCKRDAANKIVFKGDWCAGTNQAANGTCSDAMRVLSSFAAQGVQIQ